MKSKDKVVSPTLNRARQVRQALATQRLNVESFASLHGGLIEVVKKLQNDEHLSAITVNYMNAAQALTDCTLLATSSKSGYKKAAEALAECKEELGILIPIVKKAQKSKSKTIQPVAEKIYGLYSSALKGKRLSVSNAYSILSPFVRDVEAMDQTAVKAAGYEESVKYIIDRFNAFNSLTTKLIEDEEKRITAQGKLEQQRLDVEGIFQMFLMALAYNEQVVQDETYTKVLNEVIYRVEHVKTVQKSQSKRTANSNAKKAAETGDGKVDNNPQVVEKEGATEQPKASTTEIKEEKQPTDGTPKTDETAKLDGQLDHNGDENHSDPDKQVGDPTKTGQLVTETSDNKA